MTTVHPGQRSQHAGGDPPRGGQRPQECRELHQDESAQGEAAVPRGVRPGRASGSSGRDLTTAVQPGRGRPEGQTAKDGERRGLFDQED